MSEARRVEEFRAIQRESMQIAAELRRVLARVGRFALTSPVEGGLRKPPSTGMATDSVADQRNSRLRW
jgi:hypothetical protein